METSMKLSRLSILICLCLFLTVSNAFAALEAGLEAPDFTLITTTGDTISLGNYEGKVVILHFWKSN